YTFTGGAHGYSAVTFLNFDKIKGQETEQWELFEDEEGFVNYAETKFRIQEGIPQDANINGTGFMFEGDHFHLSENLGYTQDGIQLIYNQYEIASYADGPKILTIPFAEANKYLKRPVKD
ncbi:MAG: RsiV family protein, partial [Allomuricauda sp.]